MDWLVPTAAAAAVVVAAAAAVRFSMWMLHHSVMVLMIYYVNLLVDYAVREWSLVWQMVLHGSVYYCYVHLVIDISSVFVHYEFFVDCHSMRYDDWTGTVMWWYLDCRCRLRCHHYTGMFHIHSMWMSVADGHDYSNQRFVWSVANGSADGADCKLVHIHWFWGWMIGFYGWFTIIKLGFLCFSFLMQSYFLLLHAQFSMWHTIKTICLFFLHKCCQRKNKLLWYKTPNMICGYERAVQKHVKILPTIKKRKWKNKNMNVNCKH